MSKKKHVKIIKTGTKTELKTYFTESFLFKTRNAITQTLFQEDYITAGLPFSGIRQHQELQVTNPILNLSPSLLPYAAD